MARAYSPARCNGLLAVTGFALRKFFETVFHRVAGLDCVSFTVVVLLTGRRGLYWWRTRSFGFRTEAIVCAFFTPVVPTALSSRDRSLARLIAVHRAGAVAAKDERLGPSACELCTLKRASIQNPCV